MTEVLMAIAIVLLAVMGMGVGLALGRGPAKTSCGASSCLPEGPCSDCPLREKRRAS